MPRPFAVRRLGVGDLAALRGLNAMFADAFEDPGAYAAAPPPDDYVDALLADETTIVVAAFDGARVVGGLVAYELRKFEQARSEIYLYDLAVAESHRRRGIATALLGELCDVVDARGHSVVFVQADLVDAPALALYARFGVREDVVHFDLSVPLRKRSDGDDGGAPRLGGDE